MFSRVQSDNGTQVGPPNQGDAVQAELSAYELEIADLLFNPQTRSIHRIGTTAALWVDEYDGPPAREPFEILREPSG
jgi:hypothetical protein